jgi:hypothetical protein
MKHSDIKNKADIRALMQKALKENDAEGFSAAFEDMMQCIGAEIKAEYEENIAELKENYNNAVLSARGCHLLTIEEKTYYNKLAEAMKAEDPKQAVNNLDVVMPETVINRVMEELETEHPLLGKINFIASNGAIKVMMNTNGEEMAAWGPLCADIVKELTAGFKEVDASLLKLSAFIPVCKAMLDLGPEWLDNFVRKILYEALANGLEYGIVDGTGKNMPIGMTRHVGEGVVVTGGVYPRKNKIKLNALTPDSIGNLLGLIAVDPNGKARKVKEVVLLVNPGDYFRKVMPATTLMAPDGSYRNDVLPYPMTVIQTAAVDPGEAVLGLAYRYFAAAGSSTKGKIEYSDDYRFLEDERVYIIKAYANGMPMDDNAFVLLDITDLKPATWKVEMVEGGEPSAIANLAALKIGSGTMTPAFAAGTTSYEVTTANVKNVINAVPEDAEAEINVTVNGEVVENGTAATWKDGANTVKVEVTAPSGATKTYTVTVTKG